MRVNMMYIMYIHVLKKCIGLYVSSTFCSTGTIHCHLAKTEHLLMHLEHDFPFTLIFANSTLKLNDLITAVESDSQDSSI